MKKLEFMVENFKIGAGATNFLVDRTFMNAAAAADRAQQIFDAWYAENIEKAPIVATSKVWRERPLSENFWFPLKEGEDPGLCTHTAKLVDIKELK